MRRAATRPLNSLPKPRQGLDRGVEFSVPTFDINTLKSLANGCPDSMEYTDRIYPGSTAVFLSVRHSQGLRGCQQHFAGYRVRSCGRLECAEVLVGDQLVR